MTDYTFQVDLYRRVPGGQIVLARNGSARITQTVGGLVAPDLKQNGQPVAQVQADANGRAVFTSSAFDVTITETATGYARRLVSPDAQAEAIASGPSIAFDEDGRPYFNAAGIPAAGNQDAAVAAQVQGGEQTRAALNAWLGGDATGLVPAMAAKADKTYVDTALAGKASTSSLAAKADKTYVDSGLAAKASTSSLAQQLSTTAMVEIGTFGSPAFTYQVIRVKSGGLPGVVRKRFANDYEKNGTKNSAFKPTPRETLDSIYRRTGADIVINGSGWNQTTNLDEIRGPQIKDGVIYHDFDPWGTGWGEYAIGFRADGSAKTYSISWGDTAASMVADGVVNCFSFGPPLMRNGVKQTLTGTQVSARQAVGVHANGDLIIATILGQTDVSGSTYPQLADLASSLGMKEAVALDGGGSAQSLICGGWTIPSSDTSARPIADALLVSARVVAPEETPWVPLDLQNGFTEGTVTPAFKLKAGIVWFRGNVVHATQTGTTQIATLPWWARPKTFQRFPATILANNGQYYDIDTTGNVFVNGQIANAGPRYLSVMRYPVDA